MHWQMTATHTGDAFGFPASGNPVAINGNDIMRVVEGKVTEIYHPPKRSTKRELTPSGSSCRATR
jgi:hypothetical protein